MINHYKHEQLEIAVYEEAKTGKTCCGDAHIVLSKNDFMICAVIDGLGSGEDARLSATITTETIKSEQNKPVEEIVESCNKALLNKRGVVLTIIRVDFDKKVLTYCNVGNIGFSLYLPNGEIFQPIPIRGYLSGRIQRFTSQCYQYQPGSVFVMYSDGVKIPPSKKFIVSHVSPVQQLNEFVLTQGVHFFDDVTLLIGKLT